MPSVDTVSPNQAGRRWATKAEVAEYLGLKYVTVERMVTAGRLRAYRGLGPRIVRLDLDEVDALLEGCPE
ncbi:helix-turn-helix transcriptional regulator [Mycobacterium numidiamassiliense]|uniref:helix-turn-helix transcriptional regulator n=1 Tax=Mycobacterium numidiamassiliense TaxID=1841861 RepID=UPI00097D62F7|nr:excisionase family DNA-binding protein [Mycobacterium numidiamassiliense]